MILLDGEKVCDGYSVNPDADTKILSYFPDHTLHLKVHRMNDSHPHVIRWHYQGDAELSVVYFLTQHLKSNGCTVVLELPYVPNARMDRAPDKHEVFTLKHFAKFINDLQFQKVVILDPHSSVTSALFDRLVVASPVNFISATIRSIGRSNLVAFYPDEGSMKRYSGLAELPYSFGVKKRDWATGQITDYELIHPDVVGDQNILIVDDICSGGGTFYHAANALKKAHARDIYLYITHCESLACKEKLIDSGLITHIYTTDSIFSENDYAFTVWRSDSWKFMS